MARPGLDKNVKFKSLVCLLGQPRPCVRGLLETMWDVAHENGNPILGSPHNVEAAAEWYGEPGKLFNALKECRLIDQLEDGRWQIHDYWHHAPDYVRKRKDREDARRNERKDREDARRNGGQTLANGWHRHPSSAEQETPSANRQTAADNGGQNQTTAPNGGQRQTTAPNGPTPSPSPSPNYGGMNSPIPPSCPEPAKTPPSGQPATDEPKLLPFPEPEPPPTVETSAQSASAEPADVDRVVLTYPVVGKGPPEWELRQSKVSEYSETFPGLAILAECRRALQWIKDNPVKRKTAKGMTRFLYSWLERSQNQAGRRGYGQPARASPPVDLDAKIQEQQAARKAAEQQQPTVTLKSLLRGPGHGPTQQATS